MDVILEGAAQVLERGGPLTTNTIADRAGVSIGTLYQYFDSKEAVVAELSRRVRGDLVRSVAAAIETAGALSLAEGLPLIVGAALAADARRPRLSSALDRLEDELPLSSDDAYVAAELRTRTAGWLRRYYPEAPEDELAVLVDDLHVIVEALTDAAHARGDAVDASFAERVAGTLMAVIHARLETRSAAR